MYFINCCLQLVIKLTKQLNIINWSNHDVCVLFNGVVNILYLHPTIFNPFNFLMFTHVHVFRKRLIVVIIIYKYLCWINIFIIISFLTLYKKANFLKIVTYTFSLSNSIHTSYFGLWRSLLNFWILNKAKDLLVLQWS